VFGFLEAWILSFCFWNFQALPKVNKDLAMKLMNVPENLKQKTENALQDSRFKAMFENADFEIDKTAEEFR